MADDPLELLVTAHKSLAERLDRQIDDVVRYRSLSGEEAHAELGALERILEQQHKDLEQLKAYREAEIERFEATIRQREAGLRDLEKRVVMARREMGKREGGAGERGKEPRRPES